MSFKQYIFIYFMVKALKITEISRKNKRFSVMDVNVADL